MRLPVNFEKESAIGTLGRGKDVKEHPDKSKIFRGEVGRTSKRHSRAEAFIGTEARERE